MKSTILCCDIGTSSLKAGLISEDGLVLNTTIIRFPNENNSASHDKAEIWQDAFVESANFLLHGSSLSESFIQNTSIVPSAICISGNGPSLVAKLKNGKSFSYLWYEKNNTVESDAFHNSIFLPRILSFENSYPEIISSSSFISSGPEFLVHSLTNCEPFTLLPEKRFQSAYWKNEDDDEFLSQNTKSLLCPFASLGAEHGYLSKDFLQELNLPLSAKIPVYCSGPDFVAALIGTNTLEEGKICDRMGSSEGINVCMADNLSENKTIRIMPSVISNLWNKSVIIPKSGSLLSSIKAESEYKNSTYDDFFSHLCNQKIEGLPSAAKMLLDEVKTSFETLGCFDQGLQPIICTGRQARSDEWLLLRAKYLGLPLARTTCPDSELMGNAIVALSALNSGTKKMSDNIKDIAAQLVKIEKIFA